MPFFKSLDRGIMVMNRLFGLLVRIYEKTTMRLKPASHI